ncbi:MULTISPECIES: LysR family transcriptional regulator [Kitasatospora]|uniref:Putative LysR family transcriptional regulator n=1 Tax=Kitasatospora setae (strain ATCC 33774 / DSM 43861 / JCM 3304 / KCC A-0304 / NBRC 14216 / KM-6054) TaxID=452652 RepID=E4N0X3_KITSK|nr:MULTISPECIES: LysR family transcriptional regulator [Kitasatospora]BAJ31807.1 putative LysR family transcriptional regulator [Kitasatospora setae KM-6054]
MAEDLLPQELRILVAVADSGGFTAAADRLGLTQSAVSHAVRGCERKLGAVLFERGRRGAVPTAAGERVAGHARRILRLLAALPGEARQAAGGTATGPAGPVRIVAFRSAAVQVLPQVLTVLAARWPELKPEVRVVRDLGRGTAGEVADGRADLALATLDATGGTLPGLLAAPLYREEYALAHQQGHPDPRGLPLVDWDENCGSYTADWWKRQDWLPPATINVSDDTVVLSLAAQGLGMAVMPRLSLDRPPAGLAVTDLGPDRPSRRVGYVTTPELARTAAVREVIRALREAPLPAGATPATEPPTAERGESRRP